MKKNLFIVLFFILFLPLICRATTGTEIEYPSVPGVATPTATTTFPEYVKYLVNFSITISGIIALGVLIWAGFLYLTSAGNLSQMEDAKRKIIGSLLGLTIIISSYLILYTINPQLVRWGPETVEPEQGIYLIDNKGRKHFVNDTTDKMDYSNINQIEFVSPPSSLLAVYLYNDEGFKGDEERIIDKGSHSTSSVNLVHDVKSVYFLWNRPGVYLCPTTPSGSPWYICPTRPLYTVSSIADLSQYPYGSGGTYDNEIESIQIIEPATGGYYIVILFDQNNYTSENGCPFLLVPNGTTTPVGWVAHIDNLSKEADFNNDPPIGKNELSSLIVTLRDPDKQVSGTITFFDKENCLPGGETYDVGIVSSTVYIDKDLDTWDNKIRSLRISGTGGVVLASDKDFKGRCRCFTYQGGSGYEIDSSRCVTRLPTEVCDPNNPSTCPSSLVIFPLPE